MDRISAKPIDRVRDHNIHLSIPHGLSEAAEVRAIPELRAGIDFAIDMRLIDQVVALGSMFAALRILSSQRRTVNLLPRARYPCINSRPMRRMSRHYDLPPSG